MKNRDALCEIKDNLLEESAEYSEKKRLSNGELERLMYLTKTAKNIEEVMGMDDDESGYSQRRGYSRAGDWVARGRFGMPYDEGGNSYANRGQHYVRGHYSREGGREEMISKMEDMMSGANERDRRIIQRMIDEMRSA